MLLDVEKERFNEKRCEKQIEKATFMDLKMVDANKRKSKEKKSEEKSIESIAILMKIITSELMDETFEKIEA